MALQYIHRKVEDTFTLFAYEHIDYALYYVYNEKDTLIETRKLRKNKSRPLKVLKDGDYKLIVSVGIISETVLFTETKFLRNSLIIEIKELLCSCNVSKNCTSDPIKDIIKSYYKTKDLIFKVTGYVNSYLSVSNLNRYNEYYRDLINDFSTYFYNFENTEQALKANLDLYKKLVYITWYFMYLNERTLSNDTLLRKLYKINIIEKCFCKLCKTLTTIEEDYEEDVNIAPTVDNYNVNSNATTVLLTPLDVTNNFTDANGDSYYDIRIESLPTNGLLYYNGNLVVIGQTIIIHNFTTFLYISNDVITELQNDSFTFRTSDNNINKLYSNMAIWTITRNAQPNQPASQVGDNSRTIDYDEDITFTVADFTTATTPAYSDPEGDPAETLKITALPSEGVLQYNGVTVVVDQEIPFTGIAAGNLVYVSNDGNTSLYNSGFEFEIADSGNGTFVG